MKDFLLFSNKLKQLGEVLKFYLTKIGRWIAILFNRRKKIENISFNYYRNWHFDQAYLVVDFKFKNAIWFRIGNIKGYDFTRPLILNLQSIKANSINLEVFGFLQKQVCEINLNKEAKINSASFKTRITNINTINLLKQNAIIQIPQTGLLMKKPILSFEKISIINKNIKVHYKPFKTQEYS